MTTENPYAAPTATGDDSILDVSSEILKSPANPERPRWYRTSFVFVLLSFQMFAIGIPLLGVIAMLAAVANIRNDDWYKHRWPWFIVALSSFMLVVSPGTLLIANTNPDPVVSTHQNVTHRPDLMECQVDSDCGQGQSCRSRKGGGNECRARE